MLIKCKKCNFLFHYYDGMEQNDLQCEGKIMDEIKDKQKKFSFDKITVKKIGKGALISSTGAIGLYLLNFCSKLDVGIWTPVIASGIPILANMIREWVKGE